MIKSLSIRTALAFASFTAVQDCAGVMFPVPGEVTVQADGM